MEIFKQLLGVATSLASGLLVYSAAFGPPWPNPLGCAAITSVLILVVWFWFRYKFRRYRSNQGARDRWLFWLVFVGLMASAPYAVGVRFLTFEDQNGTRHAKGLIENEDWKKATAPDGKVQDSEIRIDPSMPEQEQIRVVLGYNAGKRWTEYSIFGVELFLLTLWMISVVAIAGVLSICLSVEKQP